MATKMNPMAGRYFNSPAFAAAASNLSSAFAPTTIDDYLTAAQYQQENTRARALSDFYGMAGGDRDMLAAAADIYDPVNGFGARDMADATERRGQDISSADRRYATGVGSADNRFNTQAGLVGDMMDPSGRNAIDPAYMDLIFGPGAPAMTSADPVMPSETQARGRLVQEGGRHLNADDIYALTMEGVPTTEIVTADGPQLTFGPLAARSGAEPLVNKGAETAPKPIIMVDPATGAQVSGVFREGKYYLADGTPAPANLVAQNLPSATGSAEDVLGNTVKNRLDSSALSAAGALDTIDQLTTLIQQNPSSQGLVGLMRGTAQDVMQTSTELGRFFGGTMAEVAAAVEEGTLDAGLATQMYDTSIPAIDMLSNVLAWQYAKSMAGDRVSNDQLRMAREAIGASGVWNNQASSLTRLGQLADMFQRDLERTRGLLSPEVEALVAPRLGALPPAATPGAPPPPAGTPGRLRFDANGNQLP